MAEVGLIYGACRGRMTELVRDLDESRLGTRVASTSDWTVHDVVSHLVGIVTDINAGRFDGLGSEAAKAAQVDARRDRSIAELIEGYSGIRAGQPAEAGFAPYELARLICGRRTGEQIRAYLSDGDPEPYLSMLAAPGLAEPLPT